MFKCPECPGMEPLSGLSLDQDSVDLFPLRCIHSQAAAYFGGDWDSHWTIEDIEDSDESHKVECNLDTTVQEMRNDRLFFRRTELSPFFLLSSRNKNFPFVLNAPVKHVNVSVVFKLPKKKKGTLMKALTCFGRG